MSHQPETPLGYKESAVGYEEPPSPPSAGTLAPASNEFETVLSSWWQDLLGIDSAGLDEDFFDLGGHSLIGVQLFSKIKQTYGVDLGLSTLFDARTIRQLAEVINQSSKPSKSEPGPWSPVVPIQASGSRPPLYLIPGGYGTTVLPFREVSLLLGPDQPVYGLEAQMPAPDEEEEAIPVRAARFVSEMRARQPNGPYCLAGWCGGGYVAYEMAQTLVAAGQEVAFLGIIECPDPQHPRTVWKGMLFRSQRAVWRVRHFMKRGPKGIAQWAGERSLQVLRAVGLASKRAVAKESEQPDPLSLMDVVDDRAWRNVHRYHPASYPGKSVVLIGKESWKYNGVNRSSDPRLYWCKLSNGGSEVREIPGDHMLMLKTPNSQILATELRLCIDKALTAK